MNCLLLQGKLYVVKSLLSVVRIALLNDFFGIWKGFSIDLVLEISCLTLGNVGDTENGI